MGSIDVFDPLQDDAGPRLERLAGKPLTFETVGHGFSSVEVVDLASEVASTPTPTTMREEILLLSWLLVLMRTSEDSQVVCEWAYRTRGAGDGDVTMKAMRLSGDQVMQSLNNNVEQVAAAISGHIAAVPSLGLDLQNSRSLLLSTGTLSRNSDGASKDQVGNRREFTEKDARANVT